MLGWIIKVQKHFHKVSSVFNRVKIKKGYSISEYKRDFLESRIIKGNHINIIEPKYERFLKLLHLPE